MECQHCKGKGTVWVDLRRFRFGMGFREFMTAGTRFHSTESGETFHELVCPHCDGSGLVPLVVMEVC